MYKHIHYHALNIRSFIKTSQQAYILLMEMLYGIFLTSSSIFVFLKIREEILEKEFFQFDQTIVHFLYTLRTPFLNQVMIMISYFGAEVAVFFSLVFAVILLVKRHTREAFLLCFILAMSVGITNVLKNGMQRPRPQYFPLVTEDTFSFPSGHSMTSFVFYTTIAYLTYHFTRRKYLSLGLSLLCLGFIGLVGLSRIYLGVHYPSDVLAGYCGGLAWFSSVLLIDKTLIFFKLFRERNDDQKSILST